MIFKESYTLFYRHFKHIVNVLASVVNLERFTVIAFALADLARYIYIGQEVHFYLVDTVALAGFAASALYIE